MSVIRDFGKTKNKPFTLYPVKRRRAKPKNTEPDRCTAYRIHSYPTAWGSMRQDGTFIDEKEIIGKIRQMIREDNPPCEIHMTLQVTG